MQENLTSLEVSSLIALATLGQRQDQLLPAQSLTMQIHRFGHCLNATLHRLNLWTRHKCLVFQILLQPSIEQPPAELLCVSIDGIRTYYARLHILWLLLILRETQCQRRFPTTLLVEHRNNLLAAAVLRNGIEGVFDTLIGLFGSVQDIGDDVSVIVIEDVACAVLTGFIVMFGAADRIDGEAQGMDDLHCGAADGGRGAPDEETTGLLHIYAAVGIWSDFRAWDAKVDEDTYAGCGDGHRYNGALFGSDKVREFGCNVLIEDGVFLKSSSIAIIGGQEGRETGDAISLLEACHGGANGFDRAREIGAKNNGILFYKAVIISDFPVDGVCGDGGILNEKLIGGWGWNGAGLDLDGGFGGWEDGGGIRHGSCFEGCIQYGT